MTGRPKKKINQNQFEALCSIQCTEAEICGVLGVSDKTLVKWCKEVYGMGFAEIYQHKRELGKASLRRMQWDLAKRNPTMGIWLGKQYLGQTDKIETKNENTNVNKNIDLSNYTTEELKELIKNED